MTQNCIDLCIACALACLKCEAACLQEKDVKNLTRCIELDKQCAAICYLAADAIACKSEFGDEICRLCSEICEACADECDKHPHEHCKDCAEACRKCAAECHITH